MKKQIITGLAAIALLSSCVSTKHHEEAVNKLTAAQKELASANLELNKLKSKQNPTMDLNNELDKVSYSLGLNVAQNMRSQGMQEMSYAAFTKGVEHAYGEGQPQIDPAQAQQILQSYFQSLQEKQFAGAKEEGAKFLAENGKRNGVTTLPSGLQYEVMKAGSGEKPTLTSKVKTHYHGTLINGEVFDSSVERGQPATFGVNQVIAGWTEALQLMEVGSKWKLFVPYNLAYGERGAGGKIGPFSTLVFEVELISIEG